MTASETEANLHIIDRKNSSHKDCNLKYTTHRAVHVSLHGVFITIHNILMERDVISGENINNTAGNFII
jgi:hypothetical protein